MSEKIYSIDQTNPTFEDCKDAINFCNRKLVDGIIAIGGGSVMDLSKVIKSYLAIGEQDIIKLINFNSDYPKKIPSILIPTTHGTASEVTMWGTIWNMDENKKYSISHPSLYPDFAILDGQLTVTLPMDISIYTVMDALSHSFEAIWNKSANNKSTKYAISAISTIINKAILLKNNSHDLDLRNELLYASTTAGLAFSNTATAAAHSISYPLTLKYGIPHGVASSITLIPLLEKNQELIKSPLKKIYNKNDLDLKSLKEVIRNIPKDIISYSLVDWGVPKKDLPKITEASFTKGRMDNNIVDLTKHDVMEILKKVYST
jgi:alcohol dehydrogenase class IV